MNNQAKIDIMYNRSKKNGLLVLLFWLIGGGLGLQFLYIKAYKMFLLSVFLFAAMCYLGGNAVSVWYIWVFSNGVIAGVMYEEYNKRMKEDCEILYG